MNPISNKYIAFLRGINVGGHHKVPMKDLALYMEQLGFTNVITILNSGNIIFDSNENNIKVIEDQLEKQLQLKFGFPIPTIVQSAENLLKLYQEAPFKQHVPTKDTRFYITFVKDNPSTQIELPWVSQDSSFQVLTYKNKIVSSILDVSKMSSPKGMEILEKSFGKNITTRNLNTIEKLVAKFK
ncbi:DUF1697 domain-containing protein [Belliella marina]|uniref:DUF1697 domain-containing protein n=1 Tax=Belliella marina TaxID=1644146 RepID=A0ABW4VN72_9BACT